MKIGMRQKSNMPKLVGRGGLSQSLGPSGTHLKVVSPTFVGLSKAGEAAISSLVAAVSLQFLNWTATPTHGAWQNVSRPQGAAEAERAVLIQ